MESKSTRKLFETVAGVGFTAIERKPDLHSGPQTFTGRIKVSSSKGTMVPKGEKIPRTDGLICMQHENSNTMLESCAHPITLFLSIQIIPTNLIRHDHHP